MSLTETERVFGGIHEDGINDLLRAFFTARPRHLNYGSPGFVATTTAAATQMSAISFPGVPGGIDWLVQLDLPKIDLHPQSDGLPPELTFGTGQVSVQTKMRLCVACEGFREKQDDRKDEERKDDDRQVSGRGKAKGPCFSVKVFALGHIERVFGADGESLSVAVDAIEIVDLEPNGLESVIECLLLQILRAVFADVKLPMETLRAGAFSLALVRGPEVEDDQIKLYGNT
jgi:hypothetical protein